MSTAATVPMIAPDGSSGDIPQARAQDAIKAGFKPAVQMTAPDGSNGYIPTERVGDARSAGFKDVQPQQAGFWENLGHTLGIGTQEDAARQQQLKQHPIAGAIDALGGPALYAAKGIGSQIMQSGGELWNAVSSLRSGDPYAAGSHAIQAVPIVGPALNKMAQEAPPSTPGESYASQVIHAATPGNLGSAVGAAAQVAPMVLGAADAALPGRPTIPTPQLRSAPPSVSGQNYTPAHAAAFEGALAPAAGMGKNFAPQDISPQALTPIRETAARMSQGSPMERVAVQTATSPDTPPLQRIKAYQQVVQSSLNDLEAQHAQGLASASNVPVDTTPLVKELLSHISPTTDAADASAIRNLAMRVQRVQDIGDLNTFRQELNNETSAEFKQSQIQAGRSGTSVQAASDLAGDVRSAYYDELGKATGVDYQPLKIQESNLLTTKEALQNQSSALAKQEAKFNAPSTLRETLGNVANIVKDPKTGITQTLLRESPATRISTLLQKSLADLPAAPSSAPQLSAGTPTPMQMPAPASPQGAATPAPPVYPGSTAQRMGRMLPAPPIPLRGAVQTATPAYSPDTAAVRLGRLLPAQSSAPIIPDFDAMTPGEKSAALMHYLRQRRQLSLPSQVNAFQLPPPQ